MTLAESFAQHRDRLVRLVVDTTACPDCGRDPGTPCASWETTAGARGGAICGRRWNLFVTTINRRSSGTNR